MILERRIQSSIMRWLKTLRSTAVWKISDFNNVGFPDILICHKGLFATMEVKRPAGRSTPKQRYEGQKIQGAGGRHAEVRSLLDAKENFKRWFGDSAV